MNLMNAITRLFRIGERTPSPVSVLTKYTGASLGEMNQLIKAISVNKPDAAQTDNPLFYNKLLNGYLNQAIALCESSFEADFTKQFGCRVMKHLVYPAPKGFQSFVAFTETISKGRKSETRFKGTININETVPRTILFLTHTKQYLEYNLLQNRESAFDAPPESVFVEIRNMFKAWNDDKYLELQLAGRHESVPQYLSMDDFWEKHHPNKVDDLILQPIIYILCHEYGHLEVSLLGQRNEQKDFTTTIEFYREEFGKNILLDSWINEHLADIAGFRLYYGNKMLAPEIVAYAMCFCHLISLLVEEHYIAEESQERFLLHYPPTPVRLRLLARIARECMLDHTCRSDLLFAKIDDWNSRIVPLIRSRVQTLLEGEK